MAILFRDAAFQSRPRVGRGIDATQDPLPLQQPGRAAGPLRVHRACEGAGCLIRITIEDDGARFTGAHLGHRRAPW